MPVFERNSGEKHVKFKVIFLKSYFQDGIRLFAVLIVDNHLLQELPLEDLDLRDGMVERPRILIIRFKHIET